MSFRTGLLKRGSVEWDRGDTDLPEGANLLIRVHQKLAVDILQKMHHAGGGDQLEMSVHFEIQGCVFL